MFLARVKALISKTDCNVWHAVSFCESRILLNLIDHRKCFIKFTFNQCNDVYYYNSFNLKNKMGKCLTPWLPSPSRNESGTLATARLCWWFVAPLDNPWVWTPFVRCLLTTTATPYVRSATVTPQCTLYFLHSITTSRYALPTDCTQ